MTNPSNPFKPQLSFGQILNMNVGFFGIQYSFGLQQSNMSPIYRYLGADEATLPLLWLAGPMTGLLVQPIIGAMSDRTTSRYGRRTPYFLIGAVLCSIALLWMPFSSTLWMAASLLWILDAGNNITMEPYRAFVSDRLDESQHSLGFLTQSAFTGLGQTLSYLTPSILVFIGLNRDRVNANGIPLITIGAFLIGSVLSITSILWTVRTTKEIPLAAEERARMQAMPRGLGASIREVVDAMRDMPATMKQLALMKLFQWYAMFCYWQYIVLSIAATLYDTRDAASAGFREANLVNGQIGGFYNFVAFVSAFAMVPFARRLGPKFLHAICLTLAGIAMLSIPEITNRGLLFIPMIGVGLAWASIMANPYVMLAGCIPAQRVGVYMGIFNMFIVIPMMIQIFTLPLYYRSLLGGDPGNVIRLAGALLILAAISVLFVRITPPARALHGAARAVGAVLIAVALSACAGPSIGTSSARGAQVAPSALYDASRDLGPLFHDIQVARVFPDSKTLVDARPLFAPSAITADYAVARGTAGFDLAAFVARNFEAPRLAGEGVRTDTARTMEEHIAALWPSLTRPRDAVDARSSLIPLPGAYVVPGGRFREIYYWDSYFTMLGLLENGRADLVKNMLDNFAHLVMTVGHIPNGNRTYYLGRSQPPYFAAMVGLYATATDTARAVPYIEALEREHAFWMEGAQALAPGQAHRRVVRLSNGTVLNRYWDDNPAPRPESYREDFELAQLLPVAQRALLYRNIRAAAESGWDFSSRWMRDPQDLKSLETTDLIPVDLNSLLYHAERTIAALRAHRGRAGDSAVTQRFNSAADVRRSALLAAAYDPGEGFFFDVRWRSGERVTDRPTMAAAAALFFGLATAEQGGAVAARLGREFLKPGGFTTTTIASGQQWDSPNGWPPLQWMGAEGVRRYGRADIADDARNRWLALNRRTYRATGKMTEKYDVNDLSRRAGGGEYPAQDGFGWTNGVAQAMSAQERRRPASPAPRP